MCLCKRLFQYLKLREKILCSFFLFDFAGIFSYTLNGDLDCACALALF
jgi:hypothetical protein